MMVDPSGDRIICRASRSGRRTIFIEGRKSGASYYSAISQVPRIMTTICVCISPRKSTVGASLRVGSIVRFGAAGTERRNLKMMVISALILRGNAIVRTTKLTIAFLVFLNFLISTWDPV